ncbi:hypothetical protein GQR58_029664 [Nymphon striatum]|nr:hypothetical protein GQR58_029664 [Nymphon striatum]
MITSVHVANIGATAGLFRPPKSTSIPGLIQADGGVSVRLNGSVVPDVDFKRAVLIARWADQESLDSFRSSHALGQKFSTGWTAILEPIRATGEWAGVDPDLPKVRTAAADEPVAVITQSRADLTKLLPLVKANAAASESIMAQPGLAWGCIFTAFPRFGTLTLWDSAPQLVEGAYGDNTPGHIQAMKEERAKKFFKESVYVRSRIVSMEDAERIADYHHRCWLTAFAPLVDELVMENLVGPRVERWKSWLKHDSGFTTVVAVDDDDNPMAHTIVDGHELLHLFVDPVHHGKGLGTQLLVVAERIIRQNGHDQAELHTIVGNLPAIGLYEAKGWVVTDETVDEQLPNGATYTEHVLRKDLSSGDHVAANRASWDQDAPKWVERGRRDAMLSNWVVGPGTSPRGVWPPGHEAQSDSTIRANSYEVPKFWRTSLRKTCRWYGATPNACRSSMIRSMLSINEYGAAMWCDPHVWIPEAARVLRPGGSLVFLTWSPLLAMSAPAFEDERTSTQLLRPQRGLHKVVFPDFDGVEFALSHGDWIDLFRQNGFVVDRVIELYAPESGGPERYSYYDASWARQWPP